jgi:hypothetical protein
MLAFPAIFFAPVGRHPRAGDNRPPIAPVAPSQRPSSCLRTPCCRPSRRCLADVSRGHLVLARPHVSFLRVADQRPATPSFRPTPATCPQTHQDARGASCALTSTKGPSGRTGPQNRRQALTEPVANHATRGPDPQTHVVLARAIDSFLRVGLCRIR